jgi:hypothetical protein
VFADVPADDLEAALDCLLASTWDGPLEAARDARSQLAALLHVEIKTRRVARVLGACGAAAAVAGAAGGAAPPRDDEGYQSLLDDAARGGGY